MGRFGAGGVGGVVVGRWWGVGGVGGIDLDHEFVSIGVPYYTNTPTPPPHAFQYHPMRPRVHRDDLD